MHGTFQENSLHILSARTKKDSSGPSKPPGEILFLLLIRSQSARGTIIMSHGRPVKEKDMTQPSTEKKNSKLPLGKIYGNTQRITLIFYWFIALILIALVAGIFVVISTNSTFYLIVIILSIPP